MNYEQALDYIHKSLKFGVKLGLENMNILMGMMGDAHKKLKYVHVAGTNGKGSTVAFIGSILKEAGYKVGIFTSPFIERFTERIKVNGLEISEEDLARITDTVKGCADKMKDLGLGNPTEFEIVTAIAFQYFFEQCCDIVVLEVGLGGRLDSTNIIDTPVLSVITTISKDHTDILGETIEEIAFEKAGIIKGGNVLLYPQTAGAEKVIAEVCAEKSANLLKADTDKFVVKKFDIEKTIFDHDKYKDIAIKIAGINQIKNAIMAIKAAELLNDGGYEIADDDIRAGLENATWPGRFELIAGEPAIIIDGAHNRQGAESFAENMKAYFPAQKATIIIGVLKDKDYEEMIKSIAPVANRFITITPNSDRALDAGELAEIADKYCNGTIVSDTINGAVETAIRLEGKNGIVASLGSLYYIGEVRRLFIRR